MTLRRGGLVLGALARLILTTRHYQLRFCQGFVGGQRLPPTGDVYLRGIHYTLPHTRLRNRTQHLELHFLSKHYRVLPRL